MTSYRRPAPVVVKDNRGRCQLIKTPEEMDAYIRKGGLVECRSGGWTYRNHDFVKALPKMSDVSSEPESPKRDRMLVRMLDWLAKAFGGL